MLTQEIADILKLKPKGGFYTLKTKRPAKTFKGTTFAVDKESVFQGILCDYAARGPVKTAIASGDRNDPELPSYIKESIFVDGIRFWSGNNGETYLPVSISGNHARVQWYLDNKPCNKSDVELVLMASEKTEKPSKEDLADKGQVPFAAINIKNILEVR